MTWQNNLEQYYEQYKYNFIVQKIAEYPYPWLNYNTQEYKDFITREGFVSQREVFKDEVVFDIDMKADLATPILREKAREMGEKIIERCNKHGINYRFYYSGGSGCHLHMTFKELNNYKPADIFFLKKIIIRYFGRGMIYMHQDDYGRVQTQTLVTIQLEDAPHRKGGRKTLIQRTEGIDNKIPSFLLEELEEYKKQYENKKAKLMKDIGKSKPAAIEFLESKEFAELKDGRKRALFALCAYYKNFYNDNDIFELLTLWNSQNLNSSLSTRSIRATIKSTKPGYVANYINELFDDIGVNINEITKE